MNRSTPRGGAALAVLLVIIVAFVVLIIAFNVFAASRTKSVRSDWEETLGSFDEIMRRFPATEANAMALELEQRAAALGVDLAPRGTGRSPALPDARPRFDEVKDQVFGPYSFEQLTKIDRRRLDAPPAVLIDYMNAYQHELSALRRLLIGGEIPVWEADLSKLSEAPIPNLLGQIDLHKLLLSAALAQVHAGDSTGALQSIEASWSLSRSLRDSPMLINQLVYLAATRFQTGALRHVRDLPTGWIERLQEHDFRQSFVTAMKFEGWVWTYFDRNSIWGPSEPHGWQRLTSVAVDPYARLCLSDVSDSWRERVTALERVGTLCDRDLSTEGAGLRIEVPSWNRIGEMFTPNLSNAVYRVARLELDIELLLLAMEADAARHADGSRPDLVNPDRPSTACPGDRWIYTTSADGLEIKLSREVTWPAQLGAILPQSIVLD